MTDRQVKPSVILLVLEKKAKVCLVNYYQSIKYLELKGTKIRCP